jgi:hypothetical protein
MVFKENYEYRGWKNCILVENDVFSLIATTDVGPRIISFGFRDSNNFFLELENDIGRSGGDDWRLYGGTRLWHAPEDITRTYYPDNSPVKYKWNEKFLTLTQGIEKNTGLQKEMRIYVYKNNMVEIVYRIYNRNLWPVRFAPWAISVMRRNGTVIIPQEPYRDHEKYLLPVRPVVLWGYTDMTDKRWKWGRRYIQLRQDPNSINPQKIGVLNRQCWVAYYSGGELLVKKFEFDENESYPDYQCNLETFTKLEIIEIETLGPLKEIKPEKYAEHKEKWFLFKIELDGTEDSIDRNLRPLIEKDVI